MEKKHRQFSIWYFIFAFFTILMIQNYYGRTHVEIIHYSQFKSLLNKGLIADVAIGETAIEGNMKGEAVKEIFTAEKVKTLSPEIIEGKKPFPFATVRVEDPGLTAELEKAKVPFKGEIASTWVPTILSWVVPVALFFLVWSYIGKKMGSAGGGLMQIGKSKAKVYIEKKTGVTFADVAGIDEAEEEVAEVVGFLKDPDKYQRLGGRIPKGVLIVGPPGTGKTLLARAVAGEAGVPFFSLTGSDFVEMFVGVGAARVRDLFMQAVKHAPSIIFIDELDAIGKARGVNMLTSNDEREQTLNQLLAEMDGFDPNQGVIIMAATNRPEILDAALLRPGRFDRQILVDRPDIKGRTKILQLHAKKVKLSADLDLAIVAAKTPGFVGADLANIVNEAALLAARQDKESIEMAEFDEAIERVVAGLQKKSHVINPKEKKIVAYHESGHALVAELVPGADPVSKISIIPRGVAALGYTSQLPTEDRYLMTRSELLARICVLLGGRVAEEIVFNDISTGAQNDLQRATEIARTMITQFGMSEKLGFVSLEGPRTATFLMVPTYSPKEYSEETARLIDEEVKQILTEAHSRARDLLISRRAALEELAKLLLEKEVVDRPALQAILKVRSIDSAKDKKKSADAHGSETNDRDVDQEQPKQ
ncbi:MAG: ATP-dependent zinc metalloprotease FtsH [Deltaproteobacteria bacterium]|nr:ATP-dependent zinc metalloprotease FtsH [Deltaproteobacteria bacterium]MDZ4342226.1 ATP-dependent zinc metalloprotease FtsH [Candidatus Binatia bacterium]